MSQNNTPSISPRFTFRHALAWSFVATWAQRGIRMVVLFVLAAILAPQQFGIVAMAMAYILVIELFVAQGFGPAIIQRRDISSLQLDSMFWLIQVIGVCLTIGGFAASGWWAGVNDLPELAPVIQVLSLSIPIKALTIVPRALCVRQLAFRKLAILDSVASITAGGVSVTLAWSGFGVWALVTQQLLSTGIALILLWAVCEWRPSRRFSYMEMGDLTKVSSSVFAAQVGTTLGDLANMALMGVFFGPFTVGLYRLSNRLIDVVLEISARSIQVPAFAHFSDLQDRPTQLRSSLIRCSRLTASLALPMMAIVAVCAQGTLLLLGDEWLPATTAIQVLALFGAVRSITLLVQPLLIAQGRATLAAAIVWAFGLLTIFLLIGITAWVNPTTAEAQLLSVVWMRTIVLTCTFGLASVIVAVRVCGLPFRAFVAALIPGAAAALGVILAGAVVSAGGLLDSLPVFWEVCATAAVCAAVGGFVAWLSDPDIHRLVNGTGAELWSWIRQSRFGRELNGPIA